MCYVSVSSLYSVYSDISLSFFLHFLIKKGEFAEVMMID